MCVYVNLREYAIKFIRMLARSNKVELVLWTDQSSTIGKPLFKNIFGSIKQDFLVGN